ncbi:hypothetical protein ACLOJK_019394 [Asimina triloba]
MSGPMFTRIAGLERIELEILLHRGMIKIEGDEYFVIGEDGRLIPKNRPRGATLVFQSEGIFQDQDANDHEPPTTTTTS